MSKKSSTTKSTSPAEIGVIGLGVMGQNLLLNISDHNIVVAGYDRTPAKAQNLIKLSEELGKRHLIDAASEFSQFEKLLKKPRTVLMLVPAGKAVDSVINELLPFLEAGDLIIDAGNSYFKDTDLRAARLKEKGLNFIGMGVSGGEMGARKGPSLMPGGPKEAYERVRPILEAIAAKVNKEPCVAYLGPGSVGHYVKMVHNGIEYALMQLIAETYDLMKRGLNLNNQELSGVYGSWNHDKLSSYLIEITSKIFEKKDDKTKRDLVDEILAEADQTGTGLWTSQSAMELQLPIPTIDLAVGMRDLSRFTDQRSQASKLYDRPIKPLPKNNHILDALRDALYTAMIITYAQGMALLKVASDKYDYQLSLETVARIWRGGCIIRAALLEDFTAAFKKDNTLANLLLSEKLSEQIMKHQESLRKTVSVATEAGIPIPGLMTCLSYFDAYRSLWMPANLIQAQRDYFGSHTYKRNDGPGSFHTDWESH